MSIWSRLISVVRQFDKIVSFDLRLRRAEKSYNGDVGMICSKKDLTLAQARPEQQRLGPSERSDLGYRLSCPAIILALLPLCFLLFFSQSLAKN
jgi:hypothetical protein